MVQLTARSIPFRYIRRMSKRGLFLLLIATFVCSVAYGQSFTGTWTGSYSSTSSCGGTPKLSSGSLQFVITQNGTTLTGIAAMQVSLFDCQVVTPVTYPLPLTGTVSGNTFTATVPIVLGDNSANSDPTATFTGTINGNSMSVTYAGGDTTASGTLTRTSSATPANTLSGDYTGSFTETFADCDPSKTQTVTGALAGQMTQAGNLLSGFIGLDSFKFSDPTNYPPTCNIIDLGPIGLFIGGQISGNNLIYYDPSFNVTATINGSTITGLIDFGVDFAVKIAFTMTKGATTPPAAPTIASFTATPPTIRAGQSSTLSWTAQGAVAVTINNGVGAKGATGSVVVTPTTTTTYTLTAQASNGMTSTATVTVEVLTAPTVNVNAFPQPMLQASGSAGATTSYTLTNSGSTATNITLSQTGNFFTQSPASFTLAPGASQTITITGTAQAAGTYEGSSNPAGVGVPSDLKVPVKLLSAAPPTGTVTADPGSTRVDVAAAPMSSPSGSVTFTNHGVSTLTGVLTSDVPWIIPQSGTVTIAPGATVTLTFTIDRSKRPDTSALIGSAEGFLRLTFLSGSGPSFASKTPFDTPAPTPSVTIVKVVDTVQPTVTTTGIPALAAGEVALFVPGVGHTTNSAGTVFVSDVSVLNPLGGRAVNDLKMYYTPASGAASAAKTTSLPPVPGQVSVAVADVVKNVFSGTNEVGTLHLRSKDADKLAVAASILTTTNSPTGSFGNSIPVFRSDRSTDAGAALVLTGLRKDAATHTDLYIQETAGAAATVQTDFLSADGSVVSSRTDSIDAFKLLQLQNVVPANAVTAVVNNTGTAGGRIAAYATAADEASKDTWTIADWSKQLGYSASGAVIVPVAGTVHGANGTFYRTDVAIANRGTTSATGTLRYISRSGEKLDRTITLAPKQTQILNDVIGTTFGQTSDTVGFLTFTSAAGTVAMSSRSYTTSGTSSIFSTGVPVVALASALTEGAARPIAGFADASRTTVLTAKPGTYRTNFALMETKGQAATVRVTFRFTFPAGEKAQGVGVASRDYPLNANQFLMLNSIAGEILGAARLTFGDLNNVEADFQVIAGTGGVVLFTSSVENATGDSILRTE